MDPDLAALMFRVYRNIRTDIDVEVEGIFPVATQPTENEAASDALHDLVLDVRAKSSDDGLRRTRAVLVAL